MSQVLLTEEGFKRIRAELESVINMTLPRLEMEVKTYKQYGDTNSLSYKSLIEQRDFYQERIVALENMLTNAKLNEK